MGVKRSAEKTISLRVGLLSVVALCCVLPICVMLAVQSIMLNRSMDTQVADMLTSSMKHACQTASDAIEDALKASRQLSYDSRMKNLLRDFSAELAAVYAEAPPVPDAGDIMSGNDVFGAYDEYQARVQAVRSAYYQDISSYISGNYTGDRHMQCTILFMYCDKDLYLERQIPVGIPASAERLTEVTSRYQEVPLFYALGASSASYSDINYYRTRVHARVSEMVETLNGGIGSFCQDGRIYIVRTVLDNRFNPTAVIVTELNLSGIFGSLSQVTCATDAGIVIHDLSADPESSGGFGVIISNNEILLKSSGEAEKKFFTAPGPERTGEVSLVRNGTNFSMCSLLNAADTSVYCCVNADASPLVRNMPGIWLMLALLLVLAVPMMILVIWVFHRFVTRPVTALIGASKRVEEGEMGYTISVGYESSEMRMLIASFNSMSTRLKEMFDRSRDEQMALQDARVKALQSQINPHFLNNTLEIINWEARMAGDDRVTEMIEALSTMLSAATVRNSDSFVTVADEMTYVDAYLFIISTRLGRRLTVHRDIDETLSDVQVPQLIMQPVVENAIEHGIAHLPHGDLYIRTRRSGDGMVIEVENSGTMSPEDEEAVRRLLSDRADSAADRIGSVHVGIRNVNQRLKLIYGPDSGLTISGSEQNGTIARIFIKLNNQRQ